MSKAYFDEEVFEGMEKEVQPGEYTDCQFVRCSFANSDLSGYIFEDCEFTECDLSNIQLKNTALKNVKFDQCKMIGLPFHDCHEFLLEMSFNQCQLDYSSFNGLKITNTQFTKCECKEVDFENSNLSKSVFKETDLQGAVFINCDLSGANFISANNYSINPTNNILRKAIFSRFNIIGLINHLDINLK